MNDMPVPSRRLRFGDFTYDARSGELAGPGGVVRLQPHVASLLSVLLDRAGSVVSRRELQAILWPETTVEFDDGLNYCVRQLRIALSDDANAPRYIETLPRRGYRFLLSVADESGTSAPGADGVRPAVTETPRRVWAPARMAQVVVAITLVAVLALVALRVWAARRSAQPGSIALAVLPFSADTADPMMGAYQRRLDEQIRRDALAERTWRLVSDSSRATHLLSGSLTRQGSSVRLFVELVTARGRRHLWADDLVDSYAFSGNSTLTADRIERGAARVLETSTKGMGRAQVGR